MFHENKEYVHHTREMAKKQGKSENMRSDQPARTGKGAVDESDGSSGEESGDDSDSLGESSSDSEGRRRRGPPEFLVRKYNFFLFPPDGKGFMGNDENTRELVFNPATIAFLTKHNMNFNRWMKEGVPFVTGDVAKALVVEFEEKYRKMEADRKEEEKAKNERKSNSFPSSIVCKPTQPDDVAFVAVTMATLREWIDSALPRAARANLDSDDDGDVLLDDEQICYELPRCNSFLRRCLYETIAVEYPTLILERSKDDVTKVFRLNSREKKIRDARLKEEDWMALHNEQIGFYSVFEALSNANQGQLEGNRRVPIVFHNGLMDLLFLITHFHSRSLPESYFEAKKVIHEMFPLVYDTKVMAYDCDSGIDIERSKTRLRDLYEMLCSPPRSDDSDSDEEEMDEDDYTNGAGGLERGTVRVIHGISGMFDEVGDDEQDHHAEDDALMTGCIFHTLARHVISRSMPEPSLKVPSESAEIESSERPKLFRVAECLECKVGCMDEKISREQNCVSLCRDKLRQNMISMSELYTIDLESQSDTLSHGRSLDACFCVSKTDPCVRSRDIRAALRFHGISPEAKPRYRIIWIDDRSFIVATDPPPTDIFNSIGSEQSTSAEALMYQGSLIKEALMRRFPSQHIVTLCEHGDEHNRGQQEEEAASTGVWAVGTEVARTFVDFLGLGKRSRHGMEGDQKFPSDDQASLGCNKRRRVVEEA